MPDRKHKFYRLIFSTLLLVYIGTVLYLCFASFDPEFIKKESELFNLTDKEVHFLMFIPFVPLCFLSIGNYRWNFGRVVIFAIGLCIAAGVSAYAIELIQGTTEHRGKDVWDALAGLGGAVTGALLQVLAEGQTSSWKGATTGLRCWFCSFWDSAQSMAMPKGPFSAKARRIRLRSA